MQGLFSQTVLVEACKTHNLKTRPPNYFRS